MNVDIKAADFVHLAPVLFVAIWGCLVLLASALSSDRSRRLSALASFGMLAAIGVCGWSWTTHPTGVEVFGGMMLTDRFALFIDVVLLLAGIITATAASAFIEEHDVNGSEIYAMLLLATSGMMMMVHAGDFVMLVIGLETMSLAIYTLVACWTGNRKSAEGGMKYFVMGAVASAFLLYGIALIYGATGSTSLTVIGRKAAGLAGNPLFGIGMFFVLGAMAFKVALVPFHMWAPDAYEGAPTPVSGFMASAVKASGFAVLVRVALSTFGADHWTYGSTGWVNVMWTLSALTMTLGNIAALRQTNIKRMLAYSSISHAGYILIGVVTVGTTGSDPSAVLFYLLSYSVTTIGAFTVIAWIGRRDSERTSLEDWNGVGKHHPAVALAMTLFMLSLGGMPPTAGFFAKFYLFKAALADPQLLSLVIVAAINSIISIYYYLRPVVAMYFREAPDIKAQGIRTQGPGLEHQNPQPLRSFSLYAALGGAAVLVLWLGLMPDSAIALALKAALL